MVATVGIDEVARRNALLRATSVVLPDGLVKAIVEVEMLEPLELALGGGKELFGRLYVPIHRAADIEKQQHLDRVAALGPKLHVDKAFVGGRTDGAVKVELLGCALARKPPQPPQRKLDISRSKLRVAVEIPELAFVPDLDGAAPPPLVLADAHPFGMVAIGAEGRRPTGPDPFRAA